MTMIVFKMFFCYFMSLLTAPNVKNSDILATEHFIFLKNVLEQAGKSHYKEAVYFLPLSSQKFMVLMWSTWEGWKWTWIHVLVLNTGPLDWKYNDSTTRTLLHELSNKNGQTWLKMITKRVTKMFNKIKFGVASGKLKVKNWFIDTLRQTLVFVWNSALQEKFNFYFSGDYCLYW